MNINKLYLIGYKKEVCINFIPSQVYLNNNLYFYTLKGITA